MSTKKDSLCIWLQLKETVIKRLSSFNKYLSYLERICQYEFRKVDGHGNLLEIFSSPYNEEFCIKIQENDQVLKLKYFDFLSLSNDCL